MPIECSVGLNPISQRDFHLLDELVMEQVFAVHNDLGRFHDEKIYQNELSYRCREMGFEEVLTETPIRVSHDTFIKIYSMDLLINNAAMYEMKAANALNQEHRKQALNYLLLTGINHGKLVNMRSQSVQHEFVSTTLTPETRRQFTIDCEKWQELNEDSVWLREKLTDLLADWGAFLDLQLFYDAISHFRGGEGNVVKSITVASNGRELGRQKVHLLSSDIMFRLSALTGDTCFHERHLRRFLAHTSLRAVQWVNFNHHNIVMRTITKT